MIYDGLLVDVADGAKPAGWGDDPFTEDVPKSSTVVEIFAERPTGYGDDVYTVQGMLITVQVGGMGGWWWNINDVTPVGLTR